MIVHRRLAVVLAALTLSASALADTPNVTRLALHPQCLVTTEAVYVRGAVGVLDTGAPVPGAVVTLRYGSAQRRAVAGAGGIYWAVFPRSAATAVREVATALPAPTGTLVPVHARESGGACVVPAATIGALREIGSRP